MEEVNPEEVLTRAGKQWKFAISIPLSDAQAVAEAIAYLLRQSPYNRNRSQVVRDYLVKKTKEDRGFETNA